MIKCDKCGKKIVRGTERYTKIDDKGRYVCNECYEKIKTLNKPENERIKKERMKNEEMNEQDKMKSFKDGLGKSYLSIPELQLYELMKMKSGLEEIKEIKGDLKTIKDIILFWFIIGLIGFLISIFSFLVLSGSM